MNSEDLRTTLTELFGSAAQELAANSWQIETHSFRLLVLLSDDHSWLRALVPIASAQEARPFLEQLLEANFDVTQEARYALHQEVLWGVFQHSLHDLTIEDFSNAVARLLTLHQQGLSQSFNQFVEKRIRQIVQAAKRQGQSLETTLQTLDRFYQEGLMGELTQSSDSREQVMAVWQRQLEKIWHEVESDPSGGTMT
ncbi:hypothetical protein [Leptolyngbya sp. FACHB-261]|uniref:hypothetical protein n=1 Tax=Leptolyngbya sp. FACHB-261 TaxID=2692806 RepID=UPI00168200AB|nr:hypothetical protein [Leptolyngbya sp. FACHB-261]MBD2105102.1 hypothetical protein [Leptolyngbya sp. FACHB-261]